MAGSFGALCRAVLVAFVLLSLAVPARALTLIRDADIEHALREIARPVLTAAGLGPKNIRILIVKDQNLNAFVIDTRHILIHSL